MYSGTGETSVGASAIRRRLFSIRASHGIWSYASRTGSSGKEEHAHQPTEACLGTDMHGVSIPYVVLHTPGR